MAYGGRSSVGRTPTRPAKRRSGRFRAKRLEVDGRNIAHVGMRERVIPDGVAFFINALDQPRKLIGLNANQKKRSRRVLTFQDVQNLRGPIWIGTVVEGQDDFIGGVAVGGGW